MKTKNYTFNFPEKNIERWRKLADKYFKGNLTQFINYHLIKAEDEYKAKKEPKQ